MSKPKTVFLSYAREVEQIYDCLFAEGFEPWIDTRDILPGQNWSTVIGEAIRKSDFMLVFISHNSVSKRGFVQREIRAALNILLERPEGEIFLIPVRLDDSNLPKLVTATYKRFVASTERLKLSKWIEKIIPTYGSHQFKSLRSLPSI